MKEMNYELPYSFVLKELFPFRPKIRKMLGGYALMNPPHLYMLLRETEDYPEYNGVYVATDPAFFPALQEEIHRSRMEVQLDGMDDSWIFISEDLDDFESKVKKACAMIREGDVRLGKKFK